MLYINYILLKLDEKEKIPCRWMYVILFQVLVRTQKNKYQIKIFKGS